MVREKNAKGWKQAVSRKMGIQKVEVVQVGMEPVNPELLAHARTEDKVRKMKVVAEEAARLSCITITHGKRALNSQALKWIVSA